MSEEPRQFTSACPVPLRTYPRIVLGHGGGGRLSDDLVQQLFLPAFRNPVLDQQGDAAILSLDETNRLVFSTDAFVVRPLIFPGGSIAELAVHGTINDLAMVGGQPMALSAAFILEEGFCMETLAQLTARLARAAEEAGVPIVAGDTKVVERGHGDGCYITTSGIGRLPPGRDPAASRACPKDAILLSGTIGDHGLAVLSHREGLEFESTIESDTAPLHGLVEAMFEVAPDIHVLRDPTRGGVAAVLHEIARKSKVGIQIEECTIPVSSMVQAACELLGLDPLHVANEGKLIAMVRPELAEAVLSRMHAHPLGRRAVQIGEVLESPVGKVVMRTAMGSQRLVPWPLSEQLPRIC